MISFFIKRVFDILFALIGSIFAIPVLLVAGCMVKICSPESPVIFRQTRVGRGRRNFTIYKLRTMTNERDAEGNLLPDEKRLKGWGKLIRATNIDELTQIINILKGEMSWIGPRPLLPDEMCVMTEEEQELRQSFYPGITGWEAVNEGKSSTRREMAEFDLEYVRNWSLWFDVRIFLWTMAIILLKRRPDDSVRAPKVLESERIAKDGKEGKEA